MSDAVPGSTVVFWVVLPPFDTANFPRSRQVALACGRVYFGRMKQTRMQRWAARVALPTDPDGCWIWRGARYQSSGYSAFGDGTKSTTGHRYSYERFVGPVPDGMELDHLCRNRQCVNPNHLEPVTHHENVRRGAAAKTACPRGHPYDEANTYRWRNARFCRACQRESSLRRYRRRIANKQEST